MNIGYDGEKLRKIREKLGLTREDLVRMSNGEVTVTTIYRLETEMIKKPRVVTLRAIQEILEQELLKKGFVQESFFKID